MKRNAFALDRDEYRSFAIGERVVIEIAGGESLAKRCGAPAGSVGQVVGIGGILDCCRNPELCYAVMVTTEQGMQVAVCVQGQHLRSIQLLN